MALDELEALSHRKELLVSQHANLARERRAFLTHLAHGGPSPSIGALIEHAPTALRATLTDVKESLAALAEDVRLQNQRNQTFAETGRELVNGLFQILGGLHAPRQSTYSARGRFRTHLLSHSSTRGRDDWSQNILRNAVSGMAASQVGLTTVGHNIANAGVEGYSRRQVQLGTRDPLRIVAGTQEMSQLGQGTRVGNIMRAHDSFIEGQIMRDRLGKGFHGGRQQALAVLERLVDNGASPTIGDRLDEFFNSLSELSQNPSSLGNREVVLESADRLASSFEAMAVESREVQESIDRELREHVDKINFLADTVSQMNVAAGSIEASGKMANDFRDRRDQAIRELSDLVDIRVNAMPSGGYAISLANGFSLVQGEAVSRVQLTPDPANNGLLGVEHVAPSGVVTDITRRLTQEKSAGFWM